MPVASATEDLQLHLTPHEMHREELHKIFVLNGATTNLQTALLHFIDRTPCESLKKFPLDYRTLRKNTISYVRYVLPPGEMIYFGIANVLTHPKTDLFDHSANALQLCVNIDGVPLSKDVHGKGFWPILGAVENYPVFLIGFYFGVKKPFCPNAFLRLFVLELMDLEENGLRVRVSSANATSATTGTTLDASGVRVYRFSLHNLVLDAPALSFVTCIAGHAAKAPCPKCMVVGESVTLTSCGLNKLGKEKSGVRFTEVYEESANRTHKQFLVCLKWGICNGATTEPGSTDCCADYTDVRLHCGDDVSQPDEVFKHIINMNREENEDSDEDSDEELMRNKYFMDQLKLHHLQKYRIERKLPNPRHVSILLGLKKFDIVKKVVIDYMHGALGVVERLLSIWVSTVPFKLSVSEETLVSELLHQLRHYFPVEFQRKPDILAHCSSWKATQRRDFVLYTGPVVLRNVLPDEMYENFCVLSAALRILTCRVDDGPERPNILATRGALAHRFLQYFITRANEIYGPEFAVIKVHELLHLKEDYLQFGPLDDFSAFRFESFLQRLKKMVHAHKNPAAEVINNYSCLLQHGAFGGGGNRGVDALDEYYEEPQLSMEYSAADVLSQKFSECIEDHSEPIGRFYKCLRTRSFCIRADNECDSYCVLQDDTYVKVRHIMYDEQTGRIVLCGNVFQIVDSLYKFWAPSTPSTPLCENDGTLNQYNSHFVGAKIGVFTSQVMHRFDYCYISQKVLAFPLKKTQDDKPISPVPGDCYALLRFLH